VRQTHPTAALEQMAIWNSEILITTAALQSLPNKWDGSAGAYVDFWGVVRSVEDGREISGIQYEAHEAMARHQMEMIAETARRKFDLAEIVLRHRIGFIAAGEASLFLRVASGHRAAAFQASEWIVAELKQKVPIWKQPIFVRQREEAAAILR
jgi:molybdopterin synthase catalytic subunit